MNQRMDIQRDEKKKDTLKLWFFYLNEKQKIESEKKRESD